MTPPTQPLLPRELQISAAAVLLALLGWVVLLLRRGRLNLRESLLWLLSTGAALLLTLFPELLKALAQLMRVEVPANALFSLTFVYVLVNLLANTIALSRNSEHLRRVAQECALLRAEINELRAKPPLPAKDPEGR